MSYSQLDPILNRWAASRGLHVLTAYRDSEVRSIDLVGAKGARSQLWIQPPEETGRVTVHVWDYGTRRWDCEVDLDRLSECLDIAFETASRWSRDS